MGVLRHIEPLVAEQVRGASEKSSLLVLLDEDGEVFRVGDVILFLLNRWREVSESVAFFLLSCLGVRGLILFIDEFKKDEFKR